MGPFRAPTFVVVVSLPPLLLLAADVANISLELRLDCRLVDGDRDVTMDGNCFVSFRLYIPLSMELLFEFRLFCCMSMRSNSAVLDRITSPPMLVMLAVNFGSVLNIDAVFIDFVGFCGLSVNDGCCDAFLSMCPPSVAEFFREPVVPAAVDASALGAVDSGNCCDLYCDFNLVNGNAHFFTN